MIKEERSKWLNAHLDRYGMPLYGRASRISKEVGCSNAVATGWIRGSLPRDLVLGFKFADLSGFDVRKWTFGVPGKVVNEEWLSAITIARDFEATLDKPLSTDQFIGVVKIAMKTGSPGYLPGILKELGEVFRVATNSG